MVRFMSYDTLDVYTVKIKKNFNTYFKNILTCPWGQNIWLGFSITILEIRIIIEGRQWQYSREKNNILD